jgi:hypothetical protein
VRLDRDVGRRVLDAGRAVGVHRVLVRFLRIAEREHLFALQRRLDDHAALRVAEIEEFLTALFADVQAMRAALELLAP